MISSKSNKLNKRKGRCGRGEDQFLEGQIKGYQIQITLGMLQ